ncbi:hypothetical protein GCU56_04845 [Geodermatophilus sabuli]|uniref:Uncharacterized protein n=1 Tax=Geodermatophilus sabuli TaxID=1564158 RepID=A0A7K3VX30_9ACTN|nr:hypothetical protein [Geodermatophilus sabuli]NEK57201.1 hypothetical protein [Geodermatophilus sabuli]
MQRLDDAAHVQGPEVHAGFPAGVLDGLGAGWGWVASVSPETAMEDTCPGDTTAGPVRPVVP